MRATTVVGVLGRDDVSAFRALVREIADDYGLDASVTLNVGSFSVRFTRDQIDGSGSHGRDGPATPSSCAATRRTDNGSERGVEVREG
jgi:hypothetical protein